MHRKLVARCNTIYSKKKNITLIQSLYIIYIIIIKEYKILSKLVAIIHFVIYLFIRTINRKDSHFFAAEPHRSEAAVVVEVQHLDKETLMYHRKRPYSS